MSAYINTAALGAWDDRLESQMRALLCPCEQRTPAESAAKVARANRPRNFHIPPKGSDRGDVIAPRHERVIRR